MLVLWSAQPAKEVLKALGGVLKNHQDLPFEVVTEMGSVPQLGGMRSILAMGGEPLDVLKNEKLVPKARTITSLRSQPIHLPGQLAKALVSYSVGVAEYDYAHFTDLLCDAGAAVRLAKTGKIEPTYGDYEYVPDFSRFRQEVESLAEYTGKIIDVTLDTETIGLDAWRKPDPEHPGARLVSLQLSHTVGSAQVVYFKSREHEEAWFADMQNVVDLAWILSTPKISLKGANLKYDLIWLYVRAGLECTNFKFDTTLVGSLLDENRSNALDVHVKVYAPELGGYCVGPKTRLWMRDLTWKTADEVQAGDQLVGFDENPAPGTRRKLQPSEVLSRQDLELRCYELTFSDGRSVTVSDNHAWLVHPGTNGGNLKWVQTEHLSLGTRMKVVTDVVEPRKDYNAGWVAGFLDGEGHVSSPKNGSRFELGWAQKPGLVWDKAASLIAEVAPFFTWDGKSSGVKQAKVATHASLKILQAFRPVRLLAKDKWIGAALSQEPEHVHLVKKTLVGMQRVVSLKTTTSTFVAEGLASHNSDEFDRTVDKARMDLVPPDKLLPYAGGDADGALRVAVAQKKELMSDSALTGFYVNILHPAARAFEVVERGGVYVDPQKFKELDADLNKEILTLIDRAKKIVGGRIVAKHTDPEKLGGLNLQKASFIVDFMFSPMGLNLTPEMVTDKTKEPSTSLDHLLLFKEVPEAAEFVAVMKEYASATKTLGTYVQGFMKHLRSDGRFHPSYWFFAGNKDEGDGGTNTGRLSCKDPAFQTIPKHTKWAKRIRSCYTAPPGHVVVERDYSQGELKVIACIANEDTMIKAYQTGMDLHVLTSGRFAGYTYEEMLKLQKVDPEKFDAIRQLGKAGNFGLIYGMQEEGFYVYAVENYGVQNFTLKDAGAFRTGFFETYPKLIKYHEAYQKFARDHGYVRSPLGRIRHLPLINAKKWSVKSKAERQAINSPVQGALSDMMIWAIAIDHKQGLLNFAPCFGAIHDASYNYCPEDRIDELVPAMLENMENLPFHKVGWQPQLKFTADAKIGPSMGELSKYKPPKK